MDRKTREAGKIGLEDFPKNPKQKNTMGSRAKPPEKQGQSVSSSTTLGREVQEDVPMHDVATKAAVVATNEMNPAHIKLARTFPTAPSNEPQTPTKPRESEPESDTFKQLSAEKDGQNQDPQEEEFCGNLQEVNANSILVTTNTELVKTNRQLTKDLQEQQRINGQMQMQNGQLQTQLHNAAQRSSFWGTRTVDIKEYDKVVQDRQALQKELNKARSREREHMKWISEIKEAQFQTQQKVDFYEGEAQRVQEESFKNMSDARWTPRDDATFADEITELQRSMRDWAKDYAIIPFRMDAMIPDLRRELLKYLSRFVQLTVTGFLPAEITSQTSKMSEKFPHMLLSAALAHEIQIQFFERPFFCFNRDTKNDEESALTTLSAVYNQLLDADIREGHSWRAQMLRILNPPQTETSTKKERDTFNDTFARNRTRCDNLAKQFKDGPARHLMVILQNHEDRVDKQRKLRDMFMKATEIATSLWTQKSYLQCDDLHQLKRRGFQNGSLLMEAHRLHKLEEDETRLDRHAISIVVHPAILAIGTHEGEDYDPARPRVLAKAVVWVER